MNKLTPDSNYRPVTFTTESQHVELTIPYLSKCSTQLRLIPTVLTSEKKITALAGRISRLSDDDKMEFIKTVFNRQTPEAPTLSYWEIEECLFNIGNSSQNSDTREYFEEVSPKISHAPDSFLWEEDGSLDEEIELITQEETDKTLSRFRITLPPPPHSQLTVKVKRQKPQVLQK